MICDRNQKIFDKLILREKKEDVCYKILGTLENPQYIIELESHEKQQTKFWLHRYDEFFLKDHKYGIIPESFKNYRVSLNPFDNIYLPWSQRDSVGLLVLDKITFTQSTQQLHKTKLLVP